MYTGKVSAKYVRETPSSSKESVNDREYYRKEFDPTYHPLIYDLVKELQEQAEEFQIAVDPAYDRFLRDIHCRSQECEEMDASHFDNYDFAGLLKRKGKRFAALTILTAGNLITSGFANITHTDNDFLPSEFLHQCLLTIEHYYNQIKKSRVSNDVFAFNHIAKRYRHKNKFPVYTTCGYKIFKAKDKNMKYHAYFIYNCALTAVCLTSTESMYHTFDASLIKHQTSVPICEDGTHVYFNHPSFFILAWGNGKSARRIWLEERGFPVQNRKIQASDFERYFNAFSNKEQAYCSKNNSV